MQSPFKVCGIFAWWVMQSVTDSGLLESESVNVRMAE